MILEITITHFSFSNRIISLADTFSANIFMYDFPSTILKLSDHYESANKSSSIFAMATFCIRADFFIFQIIKNQFFIVV